MTVSGLCSPVTMASVYQQLGFEHAKPGVYVCPTNPLDPNLWVRWQRPALIPPVLYDSEF